MQKRKLGNTNLEVSAVGLGCMGMSFSFSHGPPKNEQGMICLPRNAVDRGITFSTRRKFRPSGPGELPETPFWSHVAFG